MKTVQLRDAKANVSAIVEAAERGEASVISAPAPGRPPVPAHVGAWLLENTDGLFLPSIAIAKIEQGICKMRRSGGARRALALDRWLSDLLNHYASRILPLDAASVRLAGQLADRAIAGGQHPGFADVAIAAIAGQAALTILTRNIRHFASLGTAFLDPFNAASPL
jgi:toxin FitB